MDKLTRKELKTDRFAQEVGHSLSYVAAHRRQVMLYGGAALALMLIATGTYFYRKSAHQTRQRDLSQALQVHEAPVGPATPGDPRLSFPTQQDKEQAERKAFEELIARHSGTGEAAAAAYHLGALEAGKGNLEEAIRQFSQAAEFGGSAYESVSKFALAQAYAGQGKAEEAEKLLRELMARPTPMVSKEQAALALAKLVARSKPEEARKLLEPLEKDTQAAASRNAALLLAEIPVKPAN